MHHAPGCSCGCTPDHHQHAVAKLDADNFTVETAFKTYSKGYQQAIETTFAKEISEGNIELVELLKANVTRFAAYKAFKCDDLLKEDAGEKNKIGREKLIERFNNWQQTEENTARARARSAKQWQDFEKSPVPYIKWLPSIATEPRPEHQPFYNQIWAKDDPFWDTNMPGQLWGCKCAMLETYVQPTNHLYNGEPIEAPTPPKGLEGNPAKTGEVFTAKASYFKITPDFNRLSDANAKYFSDTIGKRLDYYTANAGVMITDRKRIETSTKSQHEIDKYTKEWNMCFILALNGQKIHFLEERTGKYDILFNGEPAELKKLSSHKNIRMQKRKALNKQGAKYVIFEFETMTPEIYSQLNRLESDRDRIIYFTSLEKKLHYLKYDGEPKPAEE